MFESTYVQSLFVVFSLYSKYFNSQNYFIKVNKLNSNNILDMYFYTLSKMPIAVSYTHLDVYKRQVKMYTKS